MAPAKKAAGGDQWSENNSKRITQDEMLLSSNTLQRLLCMLNVLNQPIYLRDLDGLEQVFGPEIDKDKRIRELTQALSTVSQAKDEEVRELRNQNEKLKDRDQALKEEKGNFDREKKEHEKRWRSRDKEQKQRQNTLEEEHRKKIDSLESKAKKERESAKTEASAKMKTTFEHQNAQIKGLETKAQEQQIEWDSDTERYKALEKDQRQEIKYLKERLQTVDPNYALPKTPIDEYRRALEEISDGIARIADTYFENVPTDAIGVPIEINPLWYLGRHNNLSAASRIFAYAPGSDATAAQQLRKCAVRHFVASEISAVFQSKPFVAHASTIRENAGNVDGEVLQRTYELPGLSCHEKAVWKTITLKAIGGQGWFPEVAEERSERIVKTVQCLIEAKERDRMKDEVRRIMLLALEFWDKVRREHCKIDIVREPRGKNDGTWKDIEDLSADENSVTSPDKVSLSEKPSSFAIFPRITAKFEDGSDSEDGQTVTIHQGIGLFSDSPLFVRGKVEYQQLTVDSIAASHKRRVSLSSSTKTGPPMWPDSPTGAKSNGPV